MLDQYIDNNWFCRTKDWYDKKETGQILGQPISFHYNQRKDFLHKQLRQITNAYDCVCIENLDIKAMEQSLNFGKSVSDNGLGMFVATKTLIRNILVSEHGIARIRDTSRQRWKRRNKQFSVMLMLECPMIYCNAFGFIPAFAKLIQNVY